MDKPIVSKKILKINYYPTKQTIISPSQIGIQIYNIQSILKKCPAF